MAGIRVPTAQDVRLRIGEVKQDEVRAYIGGYRQALRDVAARFTELDREYAISKWKAALDTVEECKQASGEPK